ncbi:PaaI family thioesterase [Halolamina salina]|uniref:PaaI family thioesterase n=1 Tax=Halolamina salina TaxID=1220023 RepID=A0ABD6B1F8_9EURY
MGERGRPVPDGGSNDGESPSDDPTARVGEATGDEDDRTAIVRELYDAIPFHRELELEVLAVTPRKAETRIPFDGSLVGNPDLEVLHGGIISSIVDLTGAAVFIGHRGDYTPTVDLRVNYLEAAGKHPLYATATIERRGENIGVASVEVESGDAVCATGTGVYKLSE